MKIKERKIDMEEVKEYYLGIDDKFEYFIEETNCDDFGWNNFDIIKRSYKKDENNSVLCSKEKFNFKRDSDEGFNLKKLISLNNDNLSREDRFSLVEIGKLIEELTIVSEMFRLVSRDRLFIDVFPEERKILMDKELDEKIRKKIWKLWDLVAKIL